MRSINNVDKNNIITINLKTPVKILGKDCEKISIDKNNFIDAFYPKIWSQLSMAEQMNAIVFAFDYLTNKDWSIHNERPQLVFCCGTKDSFEGSFSVSKKHSIVELSMDKLIYEKNYSIELLATLEHELHHCKQYIMKNQTLNRIDANNKRGISNKTLTEYERILMTNSVGNLFDLCMNQAKDIDLMKFYSSYLIIDPKEESYVKYWEKIKNNADWEKLIEILYFMDIQEQGAYNKESNFLRIVDKYFKDTFDDYKIKLNLQTGYDFAYDNLQLLNEKYGFNLKEEDLQEFKKINTIMANIVKKQNGICYFSSEDLDNVTFFFRLLGSY